MVEFSFLLLSIGFLLGYFSQRFSITEKIKKTLDKIFKD